MRQIQPDLWETEVERPAPGLTTHAYLLTHPNGNVLFYNTGRTMDWSRIHDLGGITWQLLSHQDEVGASLRVIGDRFDCRLAIHRLEREAAAKFREPDLLFDGPTRLLDFIDVIPTPGHTPGSTCYLVHSTTGRRYLFTGDTLYRGRDGYWHNGMIEGYSDRTKLKASLEMLRGLQPDLAVSSAFAGEAGFESIAPGSWHEHVDRAMTGL